MPTPARRTAGACLLLLLFALAALPVLSGAAIGHRDHPPGMPELSGAGARVVVHDRSGRPLRPLVLGRLRGALSELPHAATVVPPRMSADGDTALFTVWYRIPIAGLGSGKVRDLTEAVASTRAAGLQVELGGNVPDRDGAGPGTVRRAHDLVAAEFGPGANRPLVVTVDLTRGPAGRTFAASLSADRSVAWVGPAVRGPGTTAVYLVEANGTDRNPAGGALGARLRALPGVLTVTPADPRPGGSSGWLPLVAVAGAVAALGLATKLTATAAQAGDGTVGGQRDDLDPRS